MDNVRCDGCKGDGRLADKQCRARPCAVERGVESCAQCDDFVCDKVRILLGSRETMLINRHKNLTDLTEDEYDLCMTQFDALPGLITQLMKAGKLPGWLDK